MASMKIKKGDTVQVLTGKDKGATGKVIAVNRETSRVTVEGVNRVTRHTKAGQSSRGSRTGGLVVQEAPIHVSNVAVVDPSDKKPTRIKTRVETVERDGRPRRAVCASACARARTCERHGRHCNQAAPEDALPGRDQARPA
jgi:large subunit ribosomal protein L24